MLRRGSRRGDPKEGVVAHWQQLPNCPPVSPRRKLEGRFGHSAVVANNNNAELLLFGGGTTHQSPVSGELFSFSLEDHTWQLLHNGDNDNAEEAERKAGLASPPFRLNRTGHCAVILPPERNEAQSKANKRQVTTKMLVFGGKSSHDHNHHNDVLCWSHPSPNTNAKKKEKKNKKKDKRKEKQEEGEWRRMEITGCKPSARYGHSGVVVGAQLVIFGGSDSDGCLCDDLFCLALLEKDDTQWRWRTEKQVADDICSRIQPSTASSSVDAKEQKHKKSEVKHMKKAEKTKKQRRQKKEGVPYHRPTARMHHTAMVFEGDMYVFGGQTTNKQALADLWKWNSNTATWRCLFQPNSVSSSASSSSSSRSRSRSSSASSSCSSCSSSCSSSSSSSSSSSPSSQQQQVKRTNPEGRWGHAAAVDEKEGVLIISGGRDKDNVFQDMWVYTFREGTWMGPVHHICEQHQMNKRRNTKRVGEAAQEKIPAEGTVFHSMTITSSHNLLLWFGGMKAGDGGACSGQLWRVRLEMNTTMNHDETWSKRLPDEILLKIFSHLGGKDLYAASQVCKLWEMVTRDDHLWENVAQQMDSLGFCSSTVKHSYKEQLRHYVLKKRAKEQEQRKREEEWLSYGHRGQLKAVLVGDPSVGKTSLLITYATQQFPKDYVPTICESYELRLAPGLSLDVWDTAGPEEYTRIRMLTYLGANVIVMAFSMADACSLQNVVTKWHREIGDHIPDVPVILVGLKNDGCDGGRFDPAVSRAYGDEHIVSLKQAEEVAERINAEAFVACSAMDGIALDEVFTAAAKAALQGKSKASFERETSCLLQ